MASQSVEGFPLTQQQKRIWHFQHRNPGFRWLATLNVLLRGSLEKPALEVALKRVTARHEILRTHFPTVPGQTEAVQVVSETAGVEELHAAPEKGWLETPALRHSLQEISPSEHRLSIYLPSLCADDTSLRLLFEELGREYENASLEREETIEPMQYLDYGQWQSDLQDTQEARGDESYWRVKTEDEAPKIALERPVREFVPCELPIKLTEATIKALEALVGADTTREQIFLGAWAAFCARLTERKELTIGIHSRGRTFQELENALGAYDRLLPVRLAIGPEATPLNFAGTAAGEIKKATRHQEFYRGNGRPEGLPFQFRFAPEVERLPRGGVEFVLEHSDATAEPYKLMLKAGESTARIAYNQAAFTTSAAELIGERFSQFLAQYVTLPNQPLHDIEMLGQTERERIVRDFAGTRSASPGAATVLDLFHARADEHPDKTALIWDGRQMSYRELDERANQLANHLSNLGIQNGMPVALSAVRSFDMIVGLLGILKAGGAYVPIDPSYPKDRISFVLQDVQAPVLVIQPQLINRFPEHSCKTVALSETHSALLEESAGRPKATLHDEALAYVIYTSGSTGQPKGVPITHRNLAFSTAARLDYYKEPVRNYLLLSSFSFDSSIAGIFWSLTQGGTLTIPKEGEHSDPAAIRRLVEAYHVSHMLALPSLYSAILDQAEPQPLASLSTMIVAGEACPRAVVQRHFRKLPNAKLFNEYGPTEGTVWSSVHECERESANPNVPIGRPAPNVRIYILDAKMRPAPIGCEGEIYIAGEGLTNGYLNRPELNSAKFVQSPFNSGTRLYKTGDLGRFLIDGTVEFLGRIDDQVKIRGYRIELGEIEAALLDHPSIKEAVVLAREDSPGEKRLVGYLNVADGGTMLPDLKQYLQTRLPQFMIPTKFAFISSFPQTPNGKIDRKALPAPEELEKAEARRYVAPRNEDEETLAKIWADVLKMEKVSIEENFFDLGGHSLLAIQVIARVRDALNVEVPMRIFFDIPTVEGMAAALQRCRLNKPEGVPMIKRLSRTGSNPTAVAPNVSN